MRKNLVNRLLVFVSVIVLSTAAFADNDKPVEINQLPQTAQQIIKKYFAGKDVAMATLESGILDKEYDIVFTDGNKIEFDRKGQWTSIECKPQVPAALVPAKIAQYVGNKYAGLKILKIDKDNKEYDVKLSNGLEITFNKNFKVIEIDKD